MRNIIVTLASAFTLLHPALVLSQEAADEALLGEEDPARAAPAGKGVVWGVVTDAKTKEPIIDAQVSVVGTNKKVIADFDGRYRLELAPGTYELRVFYQLYKAQRVQNVRVAAGVVEEVDVALSTEEAKQEIVVEIEADPDRASAAAQTLIRKNAAHTGDAVSAQEIARTPDRNAADAARRVVGASVVGSRYVYVRGLGDRYTNALLNGVPLPSPEPDRQAVPFDLFPTTVLSDLTIIKTFTPDMPGDFTGGSVRVSTRELPEKFTISGTFYLGANTETTFRDRLTYAGGGLDFLGIDDGTRALPPGFPTDHKVGKGEEKPDGSFMSSREADEYGRALNRPMTTSRTTALPNMSGNLTIGNTHRFGEDHELGYMAALTYGRKFQIRQGEILRTLRIDPNVSDDLQPQNDYRVDTGLDVVSWGGFAGLTYRYKKDHKVALIGLHSRSSENEAREISGLSEEGGPGRTFYDTRLRFVSRSLTFGQLAGEHKVRNANDATLEWNLTTSLATSDEPGTRENVYLEDAGRSAWQSTTLSGMHFYANQAETAIGGAVHYTQPIRTGDMPIRVKVGALAQSRDRAFDARRLRYIPTAETTAEAAAYSLPADQLFVNEYIGSSLSLTEYTRPTDSYDATHRVISGYFMTDTSIRPWMRVVLGARLEASTQRLDTVNPSSLLPRQVELSTTDLLPSLGLVFKTNERSNLRASVTRTLARPQLRELAPFSFTDYFGAREIQGNPGLDRTTIVNADLRFEFFPTLSEVAAISVFYKDFTNPIEQIIIPSNRGIVSYQNAKGAQNAGVELELRKNLGFISPVVSDLGVLANLTLVHSRVSLDDAGTSVQTNNVRPLAGQSPYVVNAGLDYASDKRGTRLRVLYNVYGRRIAQVGSLGLPDVYEQPRHLLDVTVAQRIGKFVDLKLSAENLLLAPVVFTQGPSRAEVPNAVISDLTNVVQQFQPGATFTLSATIQN
ncbi:TonB-dependent receptor domain-containing protein [Polyangium spumosum]|uniref:Outer membrane beta-barrel protein n=1 Tax=Polyangium spumosum TaxID=889282 RepID=A0A6N7PPP3_9BACT|nr:TonB-dependent receptor [Polyangium spumosum]MRG92054.1 outer membrane beta-barrel protein [Polyangium spumosum]